MSITKLSFFQLAENAVEIRGDNLQVEYYQSLGRFLLQKVDKSGNYEYFALPDALAFYSRYTPLRTDRLETLASSFRFERSDSADVDRETFDFPVCYDKAFALDHAELEEKLNMPFETIVETHRQGIYRLEMYGFMPGFAYITGLSPSLVLRRKTRPSVRIPANSVAIASQYTGIYPEESPGGWYIIGRTPQRLFDRVAGTFTLEPGNRVGFHQISREEYEQQMDD